MSIWYYTDSASAYGVYSSSTTSTTTSELTIDGFRWDWTILPHYQKVVFGGGLGFHRRKMWRSSLASIKAGSTPGPRYLDHSLRRRSQETAGNLAGLAATHRHPFYRKRLVSGRDHLQRSVAEKLPIDHLAAFLRHSTLPPLCAGRWNPAIPVANQSRSVTTNSAKFTDGSPARLARRKILRKLLLKLLTDILLAAYKTDELKTDRWPVFNLGDGKTFTVLFLMAFSLVTRWDGKFLRTNAGDSREKTFIWRRCT